MHGIKLWLMRAVPANFLTNWVSGTPRRERLFATTTTTTTTTRRAQYIR